MSVELEEIDLNLKTEVIELCEANYDDTLEQKEYIEKCIIAISNAWKNYSYDDCKEYIKSDVELYLQMRAYLKWKNKEEFNGIYEVVNMYMYTFRNEYLMGASRVIYMKNQINKLILPVPS